jgi:hypothetical protein
MNSNSFDFDRIPDYVYHDAVDEVLGDDANMLTGGDGTAPYHFRCPICGDSTTKKFKKSAYVLFDKGQWTYQCFRTCGTMSFITFLKDYHESTYKQVVFHGFANKKKGDHKKKKVDSRSDAEKTFVITGSSVFKPGELVKMDSPHPLAQQALAWCKSRKIRSEVYNKWFICLKDEKFLNVDSESNPIYGDTGYPTGNEYGNRIIIPYYKYGGRWSQFDARDLNPKSLLRYRNLKGAERQPYNIDWLDTTRPFFLLEGAIDSTFIHNAVGFGGTKYLKQLIEDRPDILANAHNCTVIWDNDEAGYDEMPWTIKLGFNWFNWSKIKPLPEFAYERDGSERQIKDINDLVMYTNLIRRDSNEFIIYDDLKKYIELAKGGIIKTTMLYGNRDKMRRERNRAVAEEAKKRRDASKQIKFNW